MIHRIVVLSILLFAFAACAETVEPTAIPTLAPTETRLPTATPMPTANPLTAQDVIDRLYAADLGVSEVTMPPRPTDSPLPNSYRERLEFVIAEVAPRGGQVFVCDTKRDCDALYTYFDMLIALAGPYLFQSPDGRVVAQLNSGLSPDTAAKFDAVIMSLP